MGCELSPVMSTTGGSAYVFEDGNGKDGPPDGYGDKRIPGSPLCIWNPKEPGLHDHGQIEN
jgi:hypothetical protein